MNENIIYRAVGKDRYHETWHTSNKYIIIYMHSNGGNIVCSEKIYPIKKGVLCFIGAHKYHYTVPDNPAEYVRSKIVISETEFQKILTLLGDDSYFRNLFTDEALVYAMLNEYESKRADHILKELNVFASDKRNMKAALYASFINLLVSVGKNESESVSPSSKRLYKAIEYINQNICDSITINTICSAVHMSKYHFCREFKKSTGMTVMEYILKTRIILAKGKLHKENLSVTEISNGCGFSSVSYFSRVFKEETGLTPLAFRKKTRTPINCNEKSIGEII